jgi:hypothetical protein
MERTAEELDLNSFEATAHSFVLRIWLEETEQEAGSAIWRGQISHVPGGERRYLDNLDGIVAFIIPYLEKMGVRIAPGSEKIPSQLAQARGRGIGLAGSLAPAVEEGSRGLRPKPQERR